MNVATCSDTILQCPTCRRRYRVADDRLKVCSYKVRCGSCRGTFDARCARINPVIRAFPKTLTKCEVKEVSNIVNNIKGVASSWQVRPGVTVCNNNVDSYTKIEKIASVDDSSHIIGGVTQLAAVTLMDDSLTSFDSNELLPSEHEHDFGFSLLNMRKPLTYPDVRPVSSGRYCSDNDVCIDSEDSIRTFSESLRMEGKRKTGSVFVANLTAGIILLITITIFMHRNDFVGFFPSTYNVMRRMSLFLGKNLSWPCKNDQISVRALELRFDRGDKLLLTGVLKNRSYQNLLFPSLEIRLLDDNGVILRKDVLSPSRYLREHNEKDGFHAGSRIFFSTPIDGGSLKKLDGFQVYLR
ncbi:zinc-ribbon and DUF3426 domain-containing protein [Candidatus Ichthyocystis sparus]|nr:zinc-ribbon and DUF3426 domain-containing protein [Candidatus Ichthyocystis sparus]